jgi:hypothetical protein
MFYLLLFGVIVDLICNCLCKANVGVVALLFFSSNLLPVVCCPEAGRLGLIYGGLLKPSEVLEKFGVDFFKSSILPPK